MAVSIDTVYQKVLALANKEQRGYITPQEFALLADKAQREIYDSYFHDVKTAYNKSSNNSKYSDELEMLDNKLQPFLTSELSNISADSSLSTIPTNQYMLKSITIKATDSSQTDSQGYGPETTLHEVDRRDIVNINGNPLLAPTGSRPLYVRSSTSIQIFPTPTIATTVTYNYYVQPTTPKWGYVVVNGRALHNNSSTYTTDFMLHISEEENLVMRILQLSGVVLQKPGLVEVAMTDRAQTKQSQND